jgi:hypothetical protein
MRALRELQPGRGIITLSLTVLILAVLWLVVAAIYALT